MKSELSKHAKNVYCLFVSYSGSEGVCYPAMATIEKDLTMGRKTVVAAINELILNDLLDVEQQFDEKGGQKSNNYYPKMPSANEKFIAKKGGRSTDRGGKKTGGAPVKNASPGVVEMTCPPPVNQPPNRLTDTDKQIKINSERVDRSKKFEQSSQTTGLFTDDSESSTAGVAAEKKKANFSLMMDIYYDWYKNQNDGVPPKIDGADGKAMKQLISYFLQIARHKHPDEVNPEKIEEHGRLAFEYVLNNWRKLDAFLQKQTKLTQINSNINNIINLLKNGRSKTANEAKQDRAGSINEMFNTVDELYKK